MKLSIPEMSCGHCRASVEEALTRLDPRAQVSVDLGTRTVELVTDASQQRVIDALDEIGFAATPA